MWCNTRKVHNAQVNFALCVCDLRYNYWKVHFKCTLHVVATLQCANVKVFDPQIAYFLFLDFGVFKQHETNEWFNNKMKPSMIFYSKINSRFNTYNTLPNLKIQLDEKIGAIYFKLILYHCMVIFYALMIMFDNFSLAYNKRLSSNWTLLLWWC